jgi:CheY-like chemotaxis protein
VSARVPVRTAAANGRGDGDGGTIRPPYGSPFVEVMSPGPLSPASGPATGGETMRILAVEDSVSARRVLQGVLVGLGVDTADLRLAADAAEALRVAQEWAPDVVFLDMDLRNPPGPAGDGGSEPGWMSGEGVGRALLRGPIRVKVVMVTALDQDDPRVKGLLREGATDVIVKPVRAARVSEVLKRLGFRAPSAASRGRWTSTP